jgi:anti-sigma regulatory factor (Ser/Thr protein kinase)
MLTAAQSVLPVEERSAVGEARRRAVKLAESLGFSESVAGSLALIVTEAATNLVKHARQGELVMRALQRGRVGGVEVLALDRGPGLANPGRSLADGHSTAGSAGTGMGAMHRMSAQFNIHSVVNRGTAVRLVLWADGTHHEMDDGLDLGAVCLPKAGELACGDAWTLVNTPKGVLVCVVDGLGHGPDAAAAARLAVEQVEQLAAKDVSLRETIEAVHLALRPTRGAAMALASLHKREPVCTFCGIGNISACLVHQGQTRSMVSHNGIMGHQLRKVQELTYPMHEDALCIVHTDGIATRWRLEDYPGLERSNAALIAGVLYRDYARGRDDATVVVVGRGT